MVRREKGSLAVPHEEQPAHEIVAPLGNRALPSSELRESLALLGQMFE
jgi:hypothetical protein